MILFRIQGKEYSIKQQEKIEEIWLFGSYARGEQDQYSDLDILVIMQDCKEEEYKRMKLQLSQNMGIPMEWISLYEIHKIEEMAQKGSYFLWHIKQEGRMLYSKRSFLKNILENLPEYKGTMQDLNDYSIICKDIRVRMGDEYFDVTYELSVLASIIRNAAMAIDFLMGKRVYGRVTAIEVCNSLLKGRCDIPIDKYERLYMNRLYITGKSEHIEKMTGEDVEIWLDKAERLISCGKEIYYGRTDENIME